MIAESTAAVTRNVNPLTREIEDLGEHHIDFSQYRTQA
jgi:hypothetical protein